MNLNQLFEEKNMGFFEDTKPPAPEPATQEVHQGWFAVLIGVIGAILLALLVTLGKVFGWILKPYIAWCTNIEGKPRKEILIRVGFLVVPILILSFFVYRIPVVRDLLSLSQTNTVNLSSNGLRINFPHRSFFEAGSQRQGILFNSRTYFSYAGYTEGFPQQIGKNECQGVTRGEKLSLKSHLPPPNAEGFTKEVTYVVRQRIARLSKKDYVFEWLKRPELWHKKLELEETVVEVTESSSWNEFVHNWIELKIDGDGYRSFEVKALPREHAIVCF